MDQIYNLCVIYVLFTWFIFLLDNLVFLIMRLLKKEQKKSAIEAILQRDGDTAVFMAIINIVAYIGFFIWVVNLFKTATS